MRRVRRLEVVIVETLRGGNLGLATPPPAVAVIWDEAPVKRVPVAGALRWVRNHPEVTLVLSGMNAEAHIELNLAIAGEAAPDSLTANETELMDRVAAKY